MTYNEQLAVIVANISDVLKPGFDVHAYAAAMLEEADDDQSHFEVRGLDTVTGAPHTFWIEV